MDLYKTSWWEYERILRSENREEYQIDPGVATSLATKYAAMQIE
jgi:hypothetical protein